MSDCLTKSRKFDLLAEHQDLVAIGIQFECSSTCRFVYQIFYFSYLHFLSLPVLLNVKNVHKNLEKYYLTKFVGAMNSKKKKKKVKCIHK
jgi:hypothetical protein